jgi:hypothetical protein
VSAITTRSHTALSPPSQTMLGRLNRANDRILSFPQIEVVTEHLIHGGMYARTIRLAPDVVMMGSLIRRATILIVQGTCSITNGDERVELTGYNVLPGSAGRKQLFLTHSAVEMTLIFPTSTTIVEEAENEIFAEADQLISCKDGSRNIVTVTGE